MIYIDSHVVIVYCAGVNAKESSFRNVRRSSDAPAPVNRNSCVSNFFIIEQIALKYSSTEIS